MRARTARRGLLDKAPYDGMSAIGTLGGERGAKRGQHPVAELGGSSRGRPEAARWPALEI